MLHDYFCNWKFIIIINLILIMLVILSGCIDFLSDLETEDDFKLEVTVAEGKGRIITVDYINYFKIERGKGKSVILI